MSYHYYGRAQTRSAQALALGDLFPASRASLISPNGEVGLGAIPIWSTLSKNEKIAVVLAGAGLVVWLAFFRKKKAPAAPRQNAGPRPVCSACKDTLSRKDKLFMKPNGRKVCAACHQYGKAAVTYGKPKGHGLKKNPARKTRKPAKRGPRPGSKARALRRKGFRTRKIPSSIRADMKLLERANRRELLQLERAMEGLLFRGDDDTRYNTLRERLVKKYRLK